MTASVPPTARLKGMKAIVVATGTATARRPARYGAPKLNATGRKYRKRLKGMTITVQIKQGTKTTTKRVKLG